MFRLTEKLKQFCITTLGVKADADHATFKKAVSKALMSKKMTAKQLADLSKDGASSGGGTAVATATVLVPSPSVPSNFDELLEKGIEAGLKRFGVQPQAPSREVTPESVFAKADSQPYIRVKTAAEQYSATKGAATYPVKSKNGSAHLFAGQQAHFGGVPLEMPSQLDKAIAGTYFKWALKGQCQQSQLPQGLRLTDHDADLMNYAVRNCEWTGLLGTKNDVDGAMKINRRKLNDLEIKTLLDDSISGGIEAAPVAFDDAIILIPVLYGEIFPYVNVVTIARGRRVKGAAMANPTFTSGIAEGTAIQPFNTASFVTAFDTPIYAAVGAMEIGLDFEEDTPVQFGTHIIDQYGFKALEWYDRVIAYGDGVTEPQGVFIGAGTTTVNSDAGIGGPLTVSDFEALMFGVAKEFRTQAGAIPMYLSNDTMYRKSRSIAVGPGDERRVFGMDHGSYMLLDQKYGVQNNVPNGYVAFFNAKRYRMYRRLGLQVRVETAGRSLALANTRLLVVRLRTGGQLETGSAAAVMTDGDNV